MFGVLQDDCFIEVFEWCCVVYFVGEDCVGGCGFVGDLNFVVWYFCVVFWIVVWFEWYFDFVFEWLVDGVFEIFDGVVLEWV